MYSHEYKKPPLPHDSYREETKLKTIKNKKTMQTIKSIKPGPKKIAKSTGKPDQRQRDNKGTPGNTPSLKPSKSTPKK